MYSAFILLCGVRHLIQYFSQLRIIMRKFIFLSLVLVFGLMASAQSEVPAWDETYTATTNWVGIHNSDVFANREYTITIESPEPIDFFMMEDSDLSAYDELNPNTVANQSQQDFVFFDDSYHANVTSVSYSFTFDADGYINYIVENTQIIAGGAFVDKTFDIIVSVTYIGTETSESSLPAFELGLVALAISGIAMIKKSHTPAI